jgi:hypothetical protein
VVDEIIGKELVKHVEVSAALDFFGIAADDCNPGRGTVP